jgi:hypothetical protein
VGYVVEKPGGELVGIRDPILITPALVEICLGSRKTGALLVSSQTDAVIHAVQMDHI